MAGRWRTKSVEQSIADTDEPTTQLRKSLSWWDLVVFGVSVVIGAASSPSPRRPPATSPARRSGYRF
ncbi:putative cationic amino acid transporter domain protein [Mycobacterium xenopi 4042]|uniref:Putative cationic amino acid transporter domain protein n=1 Tax=Mycobacterium xenopi 4042 TaxID=1299334 RepID=X7YJI1_MYCXE|nr:putative cationic amino acid transporter domain protein [Mycobacterium xenopi 4042]